MMRTWWGIFLLGWLGSGGAGLLYIGVTGYLAGEKQAGTGRPRPFASKIAFGCVLFVIAVLLAVKLR